MPDTHDLGLMIDSKIPLIVIQTREETRALDMITRLAVKRALPVYAWTCTEGMRRIGFGFDLTSDEKKADADEILLHIKAERTPSLFVLCDFHPWLEDTPKRVRLLKDIALAHGRLHHTLILLSHALTLPEEIRHLSANFGLRLPSAEQILGLVREEALQWSTHNNATRVKTDNATLAHLVKNLQGMTFTEVRRLARGAIVDDGAITASDIPAVNKAKFELMDMDGVLSFEYDTAKFTDVGGLDNLKKWISLRRPAFAQEESARRLDAPKGVLLLGVQGGGKSLAAKAIAGLLQAPLLRLDFGRLYNKFFGETEKNLRQALSLAELMSPCVLWMDEIEKGIGQSQSDQGVSQRLLGTLLTWMAEKKHPVFIVATANSVHTLPPELLRKGRLDEIFFVDLPDEATRQIIFSIHLKKRQLDPQDFDLPQLAQMSEGFSGAEIEQSVVAALYSRAALNEPVDTAAVLEELSGTQPLSVVMAEDIGALRAWARERTVLA